MEFNNKNIDKIIQDSIQNTKIPKEIFSEAYNSLNTKKTNLISFKYFVGIAAVIIAIFVIVINILKTNNINDDFSTPQINGESEEIEANLPVASDVINTLGDSYQPTYGHLTSPVGLSLVEEEAQFVGVVKVKKILGYTNYLKGQDMYTKTPFIISKVTIEKVFKGDLSGEIEMMSYGGVISVSDYEKALIEGQSLDIRFRNLSPEEKENTYIRVNNSITMSTIEPDIGKYYLVFMNYSNNLESYQVLDDLIYEYNIDENKTKNTITNEWEDYEFGKK